MQIIYFQHKIVDHSKRNHYDWLALFCAYTWLYTLLNIEYIFYLHYKGHLNTIYKLQKWQ